MPEHRNGRRKSLPYCYFPANDWLYLGITLVLKHLGQSTPTTDVTQERIAVTQRNNTSTKCDSQQQ
eukprot:6480072-Amphidinium_carterae.3